MRDFMPCAGCDEPEACEIVSRCLEPADETLIEAAIQKATGEHRVLNAYDYEDVFACCEAVLNALDVKATPVVGPSGSDWELVGYFMEDGGRWLKMDNSYADDPDAVALYRKPAHGVKERRNG